MKRFDRWFLTKWRHREAPCKVNSVWRRDRINPSGMLHDGNLRLDAAMYDHQINTQNPRLAKYYGRVLHEAACGRKLSCKTTTMPNALIRWETYMNKCYATEANLASSSLLFSSRSTNKRSSSSLRWSWRSASRRRCCVSCMIKDVITTVHLSVCSVLTSWQRHSVAEKIYAYEAKSNFEYSLYLNESQH